MFEKSIVTLILKLWMKNHFICLNSLPSLDINVWHYTMFFFHFAFMFKLHIFMSGHNIIHYIQWMVFKMEVYILTRLLMTIFIIHLSISSWFVYLLTISLYHQHYSGLFYIWDDWQLWHSVIIFFFSFPFWDIKSWVIGLPWWCSGWESACQCRGHGFEPWSGKIPHAAEQLGPWGTIAEPARLEPVLRNKRGRNNERPAHRDEEWPPLAPTGESPRTETKTQHSHEWINK